MPTSRVRWERTATVSGIGFSLTLDANGSESVFSGQRSVPQTAARTFAWTLVATTSERAAARGRRVELVAVQEDADRPRLRVLPVALRHLAAVGPHPPHVREILARALEEAVAAEDRMRAA